MRRPRRLATGLAAALGVASVALVASGCSVVGDQVRDAEADPAPPLAGHVGLLEVVEWADLDGVVSVVVRNNTDRVLTGADADVTLRDPGGEVVRPVPPTTASDAASACCLDADVAPGETYALVLDAGAGVEVAAVDATFSGVSWSSQGRAGSGRVRLEPALLTANTTGAVVGARAHTVGGPVASAVVQARLQDPEGHLVAVATGTSSCFDPRVQRRVWLQVDAQVPAGTTLGPVVALPRPPRDADGADPRCGDGS